MGIRLVYKSNTVKIEANPFGPELFFQLFCNLLCKLSSLFFVGFCEKTFFLACLYPYPFLFRNRRTLRQLTPSGTFASVLIRLDEKETDSFRSFLRARIIPLSSLSVNLRGLPLFSLLLSNIASPTCFLACR